MALYGRLVGRSEFVDSLGSVWELRGVISLVGVCLSLVGTCATILLRLTATLVIELFWLLGPIAAISGCAYALIWLRQIDYDLESSIHVATWATVSAVVLGLAGELSVFFQYLSIGHRLTTLNPLFSWACGGYVIGVLVGIYSARRRRQERRAMQARQKAERLTETLSVLNRVLRHDIRNDANVIEGYVDLVVDDTNVDTEYESVIRNRVSRIVELSEHARQTERLVNAAEVEPSTIDVVPTLERVVSEIRTDYPEATVTTSFPVTGRAKAYELVESAFRNLVENAIEHNDKDVPVVTLSVTQSNQWVCIEVSDNGPGIAAAELEVLRTGQESALNHSNGVGLWLVNWIVTYSGGRIDFAVDDGAGSTIRVSIPRAAREIESQPATGFS